ncbi:ASCH domain-containing protein [Mucilaginibacter polytrichastri]|nr:ASCH domain-containing protein [Mucilaginibacter polytrichastri]SFS75551.1 Predicted transcriptional regulator, contains an HTH and PUA-like domains [Mucilaginibacter polytrichastri]
MRVILSIKPEYANKIFDGTKKYEFRRTIFKDTTVKTVIVYASSPMQKVIGEFEIDIILNDGLNDLWEQTKDFAGITQDYFYEYFSQKQEGYAIKIKNVQRYLQPLCLKDEYNVSPPQSFLYV